MKADALIAARTSFDFVRYANVWEDADVLCEALAPVARGARLLSVASAGDNALALLTLDPSEVVARDLSAAQLACVALRVAAFRRLGRPAVLAFLGAAPSAERLATFGGLAADLPPAARAFWEARSPAIVHGVIHAGKFERYFAMFRRFVLPLVQSRGAVDALRQAASPAEQARIYDTRWDHARWRLLFRAFFSRTVMGLAGRDPAFFDHVEGRVGDRILARTRRALTEVPTRDNPFFTFIVTGTFGEGALPRYLREEWFEPIRARLDRLRLEQGPIEEAHGPFAGANLSDVFEYMSPLAFERAYAALLERMPPGGRMVYWNMMAPRWRPAALAVRARPLPELAAALHERDRAWFYERMHVDEVIA
jgi:S-adenosylmethionine-diacylglycerol 3-amino-3-carboxypropyl transferase